jgi:hypothetical protein
LKFAANQANLWLATTNGFNKGLMKVFLCWWFDRAELKGGSEKYLQGQFDIDDSMA